MQLLRAVSMNANVYYWRQLTGSNVLLLSKQYSRQTSRRDEQTRMTSGHHHAVCAAPGVLAVDSYSSALNPRFSAGATQQRVLSR